MKVVSWNVNGIRATVQKGELIEKIQNYDADFFLMQETKAQDDQVREALFGLGGYHIFSTSAERKGYSGVCVLAKKEPITVLEGIATPEHDNEGRVLALEYDNFYIVNVYVPNSGSGLKRLDYREEWDKEFAAFLDKLNKQKSVVVLGDFNVAHTELDLARPKPNYNKTSGYTQKEIDGMENMLAIGLVDSFRHAHGDKVQYTFWSWRGNARANNVGWRIDYALVDEKIKDKIVDSRIDDQVTGSDHCPIVIEMNL